MKPIAILCDFDGTVAQEDVGNLLFSRFTGDGEAEAVVDLWKRGEISSRECLEREVALVDADSAAAGLERFVCRRRLDPFFKDFHDFVTKRGMEVVIMSDGLDFYIERILCRNGLGHIDFFSNRLTIENGRMKVDFPHYNKMDCTDCGCCKTSHLMRYRDRGYYIVYVGDGLSDRCPCEAADLVFAKGDLRRHCEANHIDFVSFRNFRDVERELLQRIVLNDEFRSAAGD
jgi:2,3-diketo-5-methylthio-1-phosphopentane phosphatase